VKRLYKHYQKGRHLSGKSELPLKTPVGAACSREFKLSRLQAAPTINITCFFQITGKRISAVLAVMGLSNPEH